MPVAKIGDIHIYYELRGEGEPLVVILGLATDVSEWEAMIGLFASRFRVLAFDNRGVGRSDKPDVPYSVELMADDTVGLMDFVGMTRANVLGISLGGRIALDTAIRHPGRVEKLVLVSTSPRTISCWYRRAMMRFLSGLPIFRSRYPQPRYAFMRQMQASAAYDARAMLHQITAPTLIVHGKADRVASFEAAEETHRAIPGSALLPFPGGHLFFLRRRAEFVAAVSAFLDE